jgi:hypothetical protein
VEEPATANYEYEWRAASRGGVVDLYSRCTGDIRKITVGKNALAQQHLQQVAPAGNLFCYHTVTRINPTTYISDVLPLENKFVHMCFKIYIIIACHFTVLLKMHFYAVLHK